MQASEPNDETAALDPQLLRRAWSSRRSTPEVDCGRFPIKRVVGRTVTVSADIHADGHDVLAAALLCPPRGRRARGWKRRWSRSATTGGGRPSRSRRSASTSTPSRAGSTASPPGGTSCRRSSAPGRTSRASCSKAPRSCAAIGRQDDSSPRRRRSRTATRRWRSGVPLALAESLRAGAGGAQRSRAGRRATTASSASSSNRCGRGSARGTRCSRARPAPIRRGAPRSTKPPRGCPTSRRWASTSSTCRRSIRSAGASARARTTRSTAGPDDPGSPWAIGRHEGGHKAVEPGLGTLDDFDRFVEAARAPRPRDRARHRLPGSPDHPYVSDASRVVPPAARRHDQVRGEPAEEVPGHLSVRLRVRRLAGALDELKRVIVFWIEHGVRIFRVDNPHTKPFRVLGVGDRRDQAAASRRDLPVRGVHAAEGDAVPREVRLLAVVHLLHLAQHEGGDRRSTSPS